MTLRPNQIDGEQAEITALQVNVRDCARCGGEHQKLEFRRLSRAVSIQESFAFGQWQDFEFWATCRTTGEPLLANISQGKLEGNDDATT